MRLHPLGAWARIAAAATAATLGTRSRAEAPPIESPESRLRSGAVQYGAALTAELLASPGAICPPYAASPCIIGSGGGLGVRGGYRSSAPFYFGGAYELSKHDAHKAITLAILQQLRGEARYYLPVAGANVPFVTAGAGLVGYGREWSVQTFGGMACLGAGVELGFSQTSAVAIMLTYRPVVLLAWQETSQIGERPTGLLSLVGLEVSLEQKAPVYAPLGR